MNKLMETEGVKALYSGENFTYILDDNNMFLNTEYKVLQGQANKGFVKCMKMLYNGKIQLYYFTEKLTTLAEMMASTDENTCISVITNLFENVVDVKNNGFLSCQNIDIDINRIFVERATLKVSVLYVPVSKRKYTDYETFEREMRTQIVERLAISSLSDLPRISKLIEDLKNEELSIEDVYKKIMSYSLGNTFSKQESVQRKNARLIATNAPIPFEIEVVKDSFVIGKNPAIADGVIPMNKMVSRAHCRIDRMDEEYTITDLGSANGTYVNWSRVEANQYCRINDGDIVKLANVEFKVCIN